MNFNLKYVAADGTELLGGADDYGLALEIFQIARDSGLYTALVLWTRRGQVLRQWSKETGTIESR